MTDYLNEDPDVGLMLKFKSGDKAAFEQLMTKYYRRVLNFVYKYLNDATAAEDIAQETFIRVHQSAPRYTPDAKFQTWLFTIAKNLSLNEIRRRRPTFSMDQEVQAGDEHLKRQFIDENSPRPDEGVLSDERAKIIQAAIQDLPENQRTAVLLRRYENFSYEEIAQSMGTTVKAVKSLLNRAKENLKDALQHLVNE